MTSSAQPALTALLFEPYKTSGVYPVRDGDGSPVAGIKKHWTGSSFQVIGASGALLCTADRGGFFTTKWIVLDAANRSVLDVRTYGKKGDVSFADGRVAHVKERFLSNEWAIVDAVGTTLVTVAPSGSAWSVGRRPWLAQLHVGGLTMLEVVSVVQIHRLDQQRRRNRRAAGAGVAGTSGGPA